MTRLRDLTADNVRLRDVVGTATQAPDHRARHASTAVVPRTCVLCAAPAARVVRVPTRLGVGRVAPVCDAHAPHADRAAGVTRNRAHA